MCYVLVIYGLLAVESGAYIDRADMSRLCLDWESGYLPNSLAELFISGERVPLEQFSTWIDKYPEVLVLQCTVGSQADMGKFWPTPTIIAARFGIIAAMTP